MLNPLYLLEEAASAPVTHCLRAPMSIRHRSGVFVQCDVYSQLPFHEVVQCSSKDMQLPGWMLDGQAQRRRQQQVAVTPAGSSRGVTSQLPSGGPAGRKLCTVSAKEAALSTAARRRDCTYDASSADRPQSQRRNRRNVAVTV